MSCGILPRMRRKSPQKKPGKTAAGKTAAKSARRAPRRAKADLGRNAAEAARLLRVLANPNRLLLVCLLLEEERTVGQLNRFLPLSQSALSQHLAVLREQGLVNTRRAGHNVYYVLASAPARQVIETLHAVYCPEGP